MTETVDEESVKESSVEVENHETPLAKPSFCYTDEDDYNGLKPSELYGQYKWKIEKFSEVNGTERRSSVFDIGGYKWYILMNSSKCDNSTHLSLFLCVANKDKLQPDWSHLAQYTIAAMNIDPKKSKFSDTVHLFCKKEHDWGWKKFIELPKLQDGFIDDSGSLRINVQAQVIRERVDSPFRCLDHHYRRELLRVYSMNMERICRRFLEEKRSNLRRLIEEKSRWSSFGVFWLEMDENDRRETSRERMDVILKSVVEKFPVENEVTSCLVMECLHCGLKALEEQDKCKKARSRLLDAMKLPAPIVSVEKDMFVLVDDVLLLVERAALEPFPPNDENDRLFYRKDSYEEEESIERNERRLTELGIQTMEIFVLDHILSKVEVSFIALKMQEGLIREEEETKQCSKIE